LQPTDRQELIDRYGSLLRQHGYSPQSLDWGVHGRQGLRFSVLAEHALRSPESSVLDVGCGFADLCDFLVDHGWRGRYQGIDIVPSLLEAARQRHPALDLREIDITDPAAGLGQSDFVIASGVFNERLSSGDNPSHIQGALKAMCQWARVAVSVDFLTTHVNYQRPESWHTDPAWAMDVARGLSRRLQLRCDYLP
jgi:SAM-dependent methyltransferase